MDLLIETQYLPCLDYFIEIIKSDKLYLEAFENFQKQSYRNRCYILAANKIEVLSVPVLKSNTNKILTKDVEIDYTQPWQKKHWKAIQSAYGKAPYFEYFSDFFRSIYDKKPQFLWDLNVEIMTACLKFLKIEKKILFTTEYNKEGAIHVKETRDMRSLIHPKKQNEITQARYVQVFGRDFVPNLSIVDLIFNEGPNGKSVLMLGVNK
ncbi:MAG TPA: WbqC family protein [Cytophagaceae bacterium]|jgi:hypothetical protein|nr:WbqC family protein [Cytophagaceae bacterium]